MPKHETLSPTDLDRIIAAAERLPKSMEDEFSLGKLIFNQHNQWAHLFIERTYAAGQVVFHENDPGNSAFILVSGRLAIVKGEFSAPIVLGCRSQTESIGEMALLEEAPRSAAVIALEPSTLLEISRDNFFVLLKESTEFTQGVLRLFSRRLRQASLEVESATMEKIQDPLTGLYNRRYMEIMLKHELQRAERSDYQVSLIMMDIDHFKKLNDTYGHPAGDEVLRKLAALMKSQVRRADIACRYGGEEFLIILPETPLEVAGERAETLRTAFGDLIIEHEGQVMRGNLSLGVATFPQHAQASQQLIQIADTALYTAKTSGRNRVVLAK